MELQVSCHLRSFPTRLLTSLLPWLECTRPSSMPSAFGRPAFRLAIDASPTLLCGVGLGAAFSFPCAQLAGAWALCLCFLGGALFCFVYFLDLPCGFVSPFVFSLGGFWLFPWRVAWLRYCSGCCCPWLVRCPLGCSPLLKVHTQALQSRLISERLPPIVTTCHKQRCRTRTLGR